MHLHTAFAHRLLPAQRHQERRLLVQIRPRMRNGHVHATQVPRVSPEEMPERRHATRVRRARNAMRHQAQGEEDAKRKGQTANPSEHHDADDGCRQHHQPPCDRRVAGHHAANVGRDHDGHVQKRDPDADEVRGAAAQRDGRQRCEQG